VTRALADNHAELRTAKFDLRLARHRHESAPADLIEERWSVVVDAEDRVAVLELRQTQIVASLAAHELTWAHLPDECLICRGEMRLNEDLARPF